MFKLIQKLNEDFLVGAGLGGPVGIVAEGGFKFIEAVGVVFEVLLELNFHIAEVGIGRANEGFEGGGLVSQGFGTIDS